MNSLSDVVVADIVANPSDPFLKLIYSDWLEERGEMRLAMAYRWCAENRKWPKKLAYKSKAWEFCWLRGDRDQGIEPESYVLPDVLCLHMDAHPRMWAYKTFTEAMETLAEALQSAGTIL